MLAICAGSTCSRGRRSNDSPWSVFLFFIPSFYFSPVKLQVTFTPPAQLGPAVHPQPPERR